MSTINASATKYNKNLQQLFDMLYLYNDAVDQIGFETKDEEKKKQLTDLDPEQYWLTLMGLADTFEDESLYDQAEFTRWCALEQYKPFVRDADETAYWFRIKVVGEDGKEVVSGVEPSLLNLENNIPANYFELLHGEAEANHKKFDDFWCAYDALFVSWCKVQKDKVVSLDPSRFGRIQKKVKPEEKKKESETGRKEER